LTHKHRHAQIFKAPCMRVAALLDPQIRHPQGFTPETLCPKQVAVAFKHGDNVLVSDAGQHQLFFAPHAGAIWPGGGGHTSVEQLAPVGGVVFLESVEVVPDVEEAAVLFLDRGRGGAFFFGGRGGAGRASVLFCWFPSISLSLSLVLFCHRFSPAVSSRSLPRPPSPRQRRSPWRGTAPCPKSSSLPRARRGRRGPKRPWQRRQRGQTGR
jgi:hypothetical protein